MADWIELVEAAYELECDLRAWLQRVADNAQPLLRAHAPPIAALFHQVAGRPEPLAVVCRDPSRIERQQRLLAARSNEANARTWMVESNLYTMSERVFAHLPADQNRYRAILGEGGDDVVFLATPAGRGMQVVVSVPVAGVRTISAPERARGGSVAAHVGAGMRLRLALERESGALAAEAVLDATGKLHDAASAAASPRAREWLRDAVQRRERARVRNQRSDADTALALWEGLVAGRWSLVDRFESDGKRFVVAHRNDPDVGDPRGLTRREHQVAEYLGMGRSLKEVSYTLGISSAAVSNATQRATRKLGLSGRTELAQLFAAGGLRARLEEVELAGEGLAVGAAALIDARALAELTAAERDIAFDLVRGATTAAIAERRRSSPATVGTQVKAIYAKLGVGSRVELAARVGRAGDRKN